MGHLGRFQNTSIQSSLFIYKSLRIRAMSYYKVFLGRKYSLEQLSGKGVFTQNLMSQKYAFSVMPKVSVQVNIFHSLE